MSKRIMITEYPVEYAPFNPSTEECFYGVPEKNELPDSGIAAMHYHSSYQIGICLSGNGVFLIENDIVAVKKGDAVIIAPDIIHCSRSLKNECCEWEFVYFDPFEMRNRYPELVMPKSGVYTKECDIDLNDILVKIINEGRSRKQGYNRLSSMYFFSFALLQYRLEQTKEQQTNEPEERLEPEQQDIYNIMPALKEIAFRFDESLAVGELSAICRLSESHFTRIFKKCVGMSPYNYTLKFRTRVGAALLRATEETVNDISHIVGFGNPSDFYRQFTKYYSCSPTDFRRELSQNAE